MKQLFLFLVAVLLFPRLSAAETGVVEFDSSPEGKKRYLAQPYYSWGRGKFPVKPGQRGRIVSLTNTRTKYVFFLFGDEESNGAWHPTRIWSLSSSARHLRWCLRLAAPADNCTWPPLPRQSS